LIVKTRMAQMAVNDRGFYVIGGTKIGIGRTQTGEDLNTPQARAVPRKDLAAVIPAQVEYYQKRRSASRRRRRLTSHYHTIHSRTLFEK